MLVPYQNMSQQQIMGMLQNNGIKIDMNNSYNNSNNNMPMVGNKPNSGGGWSY